MITKDADSFILPVLYLLSFFICTNLSQGADRITANQSLTGKQTIVSAGNNFFELGFFSTSYSSRYYIGIWYKSIRGTIVWVANRETPIVGTNSAQLKILDGNLVLLNDSLVFWSTNVTSTASNTAVAVLGDDGNLVLRDGSKVLWQSFYNPTDTLLPDGKLGYDKRTKTKQILTSWKNSDDPSPGLFSLELDPVGRQYIIRWNRTVQFWTSGAWNGRSFGLLPEMKPNDSHNFSFVDNVNETYVTYSLYNSNDVISRLVMGVLGQIQQTQWSAYTWTPLLFWSRPRGQCDVYAYCGAFGICNQDSSSFCSCLPGFKRKSEKDWNLKDYSGGCAREINLLPCGNVSTSTGRKDKFFANSQVLLPNNSQLTVAGSSGECEYVCLNNCSCTAYSYNGNQCWVWNGEIFNLQQLLETDVRGRTIHVRLSASADQVSSTKNGKVRTVIGVVVGSAAVVVILLAIFWRWKCHRKKVLEGSTVAFGYKSGRISVPFCSWEIIVVATENFSDVHTLGRGGFGPVYKGTFPGGQEIAVKRLSSCSVQGVNEFQNELILIAKLQHRNLVRLLGYCIKDNEKILLYEYMPNKSLDAFIFDQNLCKSLNWKMRFDIIFGIARGVLYLHHDSRLRIIHRDLKTNNILLDEEMNPKISDFGLARIVEGKGTEASTSKVVGTYGYMSPEYASNGLFSIKSDVFSFGVVVLEIISGKRNTGFHQSTEDLNLLAYVWRLWNENKALDIVDPILRDSCEELEVIKCINIGLLCVEEDPHDRPTMSTVVYMLSGETAVLPVPKQPAFVMRRNVVSTSSSSQKPVPISNELTMSQPEGR